MFRKRLEDSRKLWQFYWDMADEENWIKEKEQIVSVDEIGHDLSTGTCVFTLSDPTVWSRGSVISYHFF